ncbi:MAG TPA: UDP-N-acetylmuramoyl-tripeptide--D-alanyl-D-alanine ligase [Actinomycetota bacterium]|nr:UDP-N-acetylmuramoyl-tripeptide--D-alanyl-D-alanine ligase [Actinomycetota bacterium]
MRQRRLSELARTVDGTLEGDDVVVTGAAADSREVGAGDLFVALPGERVDGHVYLDQAFSSGAAAALVSVRGRAPGPTVVVGDTRAALASLAADERSAMAAGVVGVTGSTGKTSVKDLTAAVLGVRYRTAASPRSFNTEVGVPLTILRAPADVEMMVCEMGSRGRGHIRLLCDIARPTVGIVTNVGVTHMEMFGSPEAVADAKAELVESLPADGVAVLNADDPVVRGFTARTSARPLLYGTAPDADVRGDDLRLDAAGRPTFTLRSGGEAERVELSLVGEHMAANALAAAACGVAVGLSAAECAAALKDARVSSWRMEVLEGPDGLRVVNDAYNANPTSMAAALKAARWIARDARCVAVLGEMAELGDISDAEHERVGELVARLGIDALVTVGHGAARIAAGAVREGVEPERVVRAGSVPEALAAARSMAGPGDVVLVKGSRVAGLERLAEALATAETAP